MNLQREEFRSTPPREGRRLLARKHLFGLIVSIHAPTRGATSSRKRSRAGFPVSIHAPTRGATTPQSRATTNQESFDPRPHARGDLGEPPGRADDGVSIHAPTRGATAPLDRAGVGDGVSIHAPTRGATTHWQPLPEPPKCFDPRPHARGDAPIAGRTRCLSGFRSTPPREGRLRVGVFVSLGDGVSIHAPTRGATWFSGAPGRLESVSIHAPTRGATPGVADENFRLRKFRSTPPREGRRKIRSAFQWAKEFRSTPPREGRLPYRNLLIFRQKSTSRREACKQSKFLPSG